MHLAFIMLTNKTIYAMKECDSIYTNFKNKQNRSVLFMDVNTGSENTFKKPVGNWCHFTIMVFSGR